MPDLPSGYEVFEITWRGCWHFRKVGEETMSRCYRDEESACRGAREEFDRWAAALRHAATC